MSDMANPRPHENQDSAPDSPPADEDGAARKVILNQFGEAYPQKTSPANLKHHTIRRLLQRARGFSLLNVTLTAIIALSTVAQTINSCNNNKNAGEQANRLITAADRVDSAAESFSGSASGINGGMSNAVTELRSQVDQMNASREAADRNSAATLQTTIESFHNEDRAWVGISSAKPLSYKRTEPSQPAEFTVAFTLRNYGRSTARHVKFLAKLESDPLATGMSCDEVAANNHLGDVLLPTQERTLNWVII